MQGTGRTYIALVVAQRSGRYIAYTRVVWLHDTRVIWYFGLLI